MNDVKWLKLDPNFLDGTSFKFMRRAKIDGVADLRDKLESVWFELIGLAGKINNQGMFYNDEIAYKSFEDIAIMLDRTTEEVQICMDFYVKHNMVTIIKDCYLLTNWAKFQNVDGLELIREKGRLRQQKFRAKNKLLIENKENVTLRNVAGNISVTHPSQEKLDLEVDLDKDKESITNKDIVQIPTNELEPNIDINKNNSQLPKKRQIYSLKDFNRFWEIYPKKIGKPKCINWFKSHKANSELTDTIIKSVKDHMKLEQWQDRKYIPLPFTYLNQHRWEDVLDINDYAEDSNLVDKSIDNDSQEELEDLDLSDVLGD